MIVRWCPRKAATTERVGVGEAVHAAAVERAGEGEVKRKLATETDIKLQQQK